jgi:hypothetical protein
MNLAETIRASLFRWLKDWAAKESGGTGTSLTMVEKIRSGPRLIDRKI